MLAFVAEHGLITAREIAAVLGITERTVHRIISDLEAEGYLRRSRVGRVNEYEIPPDLPLKRYERRDIAVGDLLKVLLPSNGSTEGYPKSAGRTRSRKPAS